MSNDHKEQVNIILIGLESIDSVAELAGHLNALLAARNGSRKLGDMIPPEVRTALKRAEKDTQTVELAKQLRKQFGNKLLSNALGVSERTVRGWIAGEKFPTPDHAETIKSFAKCANISAN